MHGADRLHSIRKPLVRNLREAASQTLMSQNSEESAPDRVVPLPTSAQVVPFERPPSELQKAIQQRAQESLDRERERTLLHRAPPWRRALVLALAVIPVFLTFGAAIGFVGALRQFNSAIFDSAVAGSSTDSQATTPAPPSTGDQPEVVLIQPYAIPAPPADTAVPQKR